MDLTADGLTRVLAVCCGEEPEVPVESLLLLRKSQPSFAATLYAAWRKEGVVLNSAMAYELDTQLDRQRRYQTLAADLERSVPGIVPVKGLEVAAHYPAGLTRYMNDLDYVADEPALWRLVDKLTGDGWDLDTATFLNIDGRLHVLVSMRQPHADPFTLPYGVEVASFVALGNLAGVPPLVQLPPRWRDPAVKNLMMLLFERFEQRYRARDLVDAALLLAAVEDAEALHLEIGRLRLWPEYAELTALLARAELASTPAVSRAGTATVTPVGTADVTGVGTADVTGVGTATVTRVGVATVTRVGIADVTRVGIATVTRVGIADVVRSRLGRTGHRLAGLRHPAATTARHLQRRLVYGGHSLPERLLWAAAERRLDAGRALRAGLLCFGLPVPGIRPDVDRATVRERDDLTYVDTPSARFLLTAGEDVEEEALDRLTAGSDPGTEKATVPAAGREQAGAPVR